MSRACSKFGDSQVKGMSKVSNNVRNILDTDRDLFEG